MKAQRVHKDKSLKKSVLNVLTFIGNEQRKKIKL
jgi:hypothetical protein